MKFKFATCNNYYTKFELSVHLLKKVKTNIENPSDNWI